MKNIFRLLTLSLFISLFISCEDEDKSVYDIGITPENTGAIAIIDIEEPVLDVTNLSGSAFRAIISTPGNNVVSYDVSVRRLSSGLQSDVGFIKTLTSFPAELSISAEEISTAIGVPVSDFLAGDEFVVFGTVTDDNGRVFTFNNLDSDLASEGGQRQAMRYSTFISCPYVESEIVGTYSVELGAGLYAPGTQFEVIAGPEENQYSIVDFGDIDLVVDVDPATGITTPLNDVFLTFASGLALAPTGNPAGFTFSCTGKINLTGFAYSCCGGFPLVLNKI